MTPKPGVRAADSAPGPFPGSVDGAVAAALEKLSVGDGTGPRRSVSAAQLAEDTGLPVRSVQRALGKLVSEGRAKKAGGGLFVAMRPRRA